MSARRTSTLGSRISARYFVIVRRATRSPCCASRRASSASESGARGSSAAMSSFITARTAVAAALGGQPPREEVLELEQAARRGHVLAVGHAAHGGFVQAELARDQLERERLHRDLAVLEEPALPRHDRVGHALDRREPLLDGAQQPARFL